MNLDMWFKDDIRNVLRGVGLAGSRPEASATDTEGVAFQAGFRAALAAVALSFGIVPHDVADVGSSDHLGVTGTPQLPLYKQARGVAAAARVREPMLYIDSMTDGSALAQVQP